MKSYHQSFGAPMGEPIEAVEEILMELLDALGVDYEASEDVLYEKLKAAHGDSRVNASELSQNDKAHILDQAIDFTNESFYELEDDGIDSDMCERNVLNALRRVLSEL